MRPPERELACERPERARRPGPAPRRNTARARRAAAGFDSATLSPYWITTDRSVVQHTKKHLQCTPVQVAYRVFNRDQSVMDGQFIVFFMPAISFFDSIGFYHSSGAPPVGADYLLGCKIVTVKGYDFVPWTAIFNTNSPNYGQVRSLQQHQRC